MLEPGVNEAASDSPRRKCRLAPLSEFRFTMMKGPSRWSPRHPNPLQAGSSERRIAHGVILLRVGRGRWVPWDNLEACSESRDTAFWFLTVSSF